MGARRDTKEEAHRRRSAGGDLTVRLLEITAELLKLSRDEARDTELLAVIKELRNVRARLMDRMRAAAS